MGKKTAALELGMALLLGDPFWDESSNHVVWTDEDGCIHIRNSERGTLYKCPQRWWWAWREGLRPKETAKALWFGSAIHAALADYYRPGTKRSMDYIDRFREYADMEEEYIRTNVGDVDEEKWVDARVLGETMLEGYHKHYAGDRKWDVIATEQTFSVRIPFPKGVTETDRIFWDIVRKNYGEFFILDGTFDGVYRDRADKRIKLMEHKTAGTVSVGHLPMDNQAGTYWMVAQTVGIDQGWLKKDEQIQSIMYNFLRKSLPDERPTDAQGYATNKPTKEHYRSALEEAGWDVPAAYTLAKMAELAAQESLTVVGDRSKRQSPPLFVRHPVRRTKAQRRTQLERVQKDMRRMILIAHGLEDLSKHPGRDTCPMCPFKDMCELHESGAGWVEFRDAMYRSSDPYAEHRKDAGAA